MTPAPATAAPPRAQDGPAPERRRQGDAAPVPPGGVQTDAGGKVRQPAEVQPRPLRGAAVRHAVPRAPQRAVLGPA